MAGDLLINMPLLVPFKRLVLVCGATAQLAAIDPVSDDTGGVQGGAIDRYGEFLHLRDSLRVVTLT